MNARHLVASWILPSLLGRMAAYGGSIIDPPPGEASAKGELPGPNQGEGLAP
jgi:hypothetical protein